MTAARQIAFGKAAGEAPLAYWGLCFTAEEDGSIVSMEAAGSAPSVSLETSYDGEIWEPFYVGETSITLNKGDRVYFKAGEGGNTAFATSNTAYNNFSLTTGKISASGDIMSLLNGEETSDTISASYCFTDLFRGCTSLVTAPELPATTLAARCYSVMFHGCSSLTTAPALPATTLASNCYRSMFYGCSSLTTAPALPATELADYCYYGMFNYCSSLTTAPELPATTLAASCYYGTFTYCTSLTTAPALPATTLANECYRNLFYGCSSLSRVTVSFSDWSPTSATTDWVHSVPSTGAFYCPTALGTNETIKRGKAYCPSGWIVTNTD